MASKLSTAIASLAVGILATSAAHSADIGLKDTIKGGTDVPYEAPTTWAGPYVGIHGGYAWGKADHRETNGGMDGHDVYNVEGGFGGGTVGYNVQFQNIVFGIEVDAGYMDLTGEGMVPSSSPKHHQDLELDAGVYGVVAGRVGFAVLDRTLLYGKAGLALFAGDATQATTKPGWETEGTGSFSGFAYGGGIEHKFNKQWSLKVEYLRFDFGKETGSQVFTADKPDGFVFNNETDLVVDTIKVGLNYQF